MEVLPVKIWRKIIIIILVVSLSFPTQKAEAIVPAVVAALGFSTLAEWIAYYTASIAGHIAIGVVLGGYVDSKMAYTGRTSTDKIGVSTAGDVIDPGKVIWVDTSQLTDGTVTQEVKVAPSAMKIPIGTIRRIVDANPTKYPKLKAAETSNNTYTYGQPVPNECVGAETGQSYTLAEQAHSASSDMIQHSDSYYSGNNNMVYKYTLVSSRMAGSNQLDIWSESVKYFVPPDATSNLKRKMNNSGTISVDVMDETGTIIDQIYKEGTFNSDFTPVMIPSVIITDQQTADSAAAGTAPPSPTGTPSPVSNSTNPGPPVFPANIPGAQLPPGYSTTPSSSGGSSSGGSSGGSGTSSGSVTQGLKDFFSGTSYTTAVAQGPKSFSFDSFNKLKGVMSATFPFNHMSRIPEYLAMLVTDGSAPHFEMPIYGTTKLTIDLSFFDPVAAVFRWILALLMSIGIIQLAVNFFRGR